MILKQNFTGRMGFLKQSQILSVVDTLLTTPIFSRHFCLPTKPPEYYSTHFLFSAHISYGKGKYLNQTGFFFFFFYKICQDFIYV